MTVPKIGETISQGNWTVKRGPNGMIHAAARASIEPRGPLYSV